ncbi:polyprenyl synthetase family protein [Streptomyces sp. NPDC051907]|uniref:polyprenyl synthetase family protein n=1 Tax=Streptomyces sp. NPDC051907 TaxID=3155284 RepID=UPI0034150CC2
MLGTRMTRATRAGADGRARHDAVPGTPDDTVPGTAHDTVPGTAHDAITGVDAVLAEYLDARLREAHEVDALSATEMAARVADFVQRGGKRLRSAFVWCGWRAAGAGGDPGAPLRVGAALELVQACALIHDDVMDGSPMRRGAPTVHADFASTHRAAHMHGSAEPYATAAAVLAGDLALAWADDLLTDTALSSPHGARLHREWQRMRGEMVAGQYLDLRAQATGSSAEDEALYIATLKSALYTVERPLALGACLAGADSGTTKALRSAGRCAGLAFQLRDDLLGAFGDPAATGKPADEDLRARKLTYLLAVAVRLAAESGDTEAAAALRPNTAAHSDDEVSLMRAAMERTGARAAVEEEISRLSERGVRHFADTGADHHVQREFAALLDRAVGAAPARSGEGT